MKKFLCSYAYDCPYYADFTVQANTEQEAEVMVKAALKKKKFERVEGVHDGSFASERVFVAEEIKPDNGGYYPTLVELLEDAENN
jgi:hypothetical protein